MKISKPIMAVSLSVAFAGVMANAVTINNPSTRSIPFKYQVAYHQPGQSVVIAHTAQSMVPAHSQVSIPVMRDKRYRYVGLVMLAVKKNIKEKHWHQLPSSARQFDGRHGCWVKTSKRNKQGRMMLVYHRQGQRGVITCRT